MGKKIKTFAFRYGLPLLGFGLIVLFDVTVARNLALKPDLSTLIILLLIATAWFLGRGPGLLIALIFEATLIYFAYYSTGNPYTAKSAFTTINRLVLFGSIALFASARRSAEKKLREQRELLRVTIASIGDAVIATDLEGKINFINPTAENLTGWTMADAAGKPLEDVFRIINEETREAVESPFHKILREKRVVGLANHTVLIARGGQEIPIEDSGAPIKDARGELLGTIVVFHDVGERRRAEQERDMLLQSEQKARREAESATRVKDEFLATVSHELRTPLSAILGWASIIKQSEYDEKTARRAVTIIERNAKAQAEIIGSILDVSRIITGKMKINPELVAIAPLVQQTVENLRPAAVAKSLNIDFLHDGTANSASEVIGDPDRLQQVFWNLIINAIKFTGEGGNIEITLREKDARLEIEVRDDGIGIRPEALPFIFERFSQGDSSTTREHGGLGLGLAIVRHLTEMHGGTVEAKSEGSGTGAVFIVSLPLAPKQVREPASDALQATVKLDSADRISSDMPDLDGLRVLLVDDDTDTLDILSFALDRYGAKVRTAVSSADALKVFHEWQPDVLISDIAMPLEDGFSLIGKIRALPREKGGNIPAAALTAYAGEIDRQKAINAGFQIHVAKPVDPTALAVEVLKLSKHN